jgi:hypothetical protein
MKHTLNEKFFGVFVFAQKIIEVGLHKAHKSFAEIHLQGHRTGDTGRTKRERMTPSSGHAAMRNMGDEVRRRSEGSSEQGERKKLKPDHFLVYFLMLVCSRWRPSRTGQFCSLNCQS